MNRSNIYNVIHLSFSFFLIFISYTVAQIFQTSSDHAEHGALAVGIIYLLFCLANLSLASYVIDFLGVRLTLILSSLAYILFIGANIRYNVWLLYISASLLGVSAALLWTSQGVYVALSIVKHERVNNLETSSTQGSINGIFQGVFQLHLIVGNLFVSLLFRLNYPQWIIFTILTIISAIGSLSLVFLRPIELPDHPKKRTIVGSLSMLLEIPFLALVPTICYIGLVQGFIFGAIPPLIGDKSQKFLLFAFYGLVTVCAAIVSGRLSDYFGRRLFIFAIAAISHATIFGLLLLLWKPPFEPNRWEVFIVMITCFSMGDAIFVTQLYAVISILYGGKRPTDAFACLKFFQAGSSAISFVTQVYFSFSIQILYLIPILLFSLTTLTYTNYAIVPLDADKAITSKEEKKTEVEIPLTVMTESAQND